MNIELYYFSGTGNTLAVAKEIAVKTGAELIPVRKVISKDAISIGAPVYRAFR